VNGLAAAKRPDRSKLEQQNGQAIAQPFAAVGG
jgi:hypothetical protein